MLTNDLKKLMNGCAKKNGESFYSQTVGHRRGGIQMKAGYAVKNSTHSEQDFEEILEKFKEEDEE
jgi:hypothetical protein